MNISGLQKLTLLDFPGRTACTLFTAGCNFRCPFCHNASLVRGEAEPLMSEAEFFDFLEKRRGKLDGVAVTGGEPLLQPDIEDFLKEIKKRGFLVKLDTNGSFPHKLERIISGSLADYIAMDIKNCPEKYAETAGLSRDITEDIDRSIRLIMDSGTDYEFRTTVVSPYHTAADIEGIARRIQGARRYFLQQFRNSGDILEEGCSAVPADTLALMRAAATRFTGTCELRGI